MEENGEELIRIKECYVQLSEESRGLEHRLKEEFDQEKEILMAEVRLEDQGRMRAVVCRRPLVYTSHNVVEHKGKDRLCNGITIIRFSCINFR